MKTLKTKSKKKACTPFFPGFIDDYGICGIYVLAFFSLLLGVRTGKHWILLIPAGIFVLYDSWFRWFRPKRNNWIASGRNKKETLSSIRMASQYTSFFIAFIGLSLSLLLDKGKNIPEGILNLFKDPFLSSYAFIVLAFSGVLLLFIPVPYLKHSKKEPSVALKNCFFCVLLMEKIIILFLVYLIILITQAGLSI